ncbi:trypsin-like serine protease [Agromyces intestinalis]|uniref:Trypsin-like serine protease n=1 Tax=Agromyces intestinalis TaxID=2592652 RepID=A0A5C1YFY3_9MICO|nr:trypsin-like peptidase domain-containing protein [Agromyces intestinalis]QEO15106.1 trypsin-like serine protease [Agromyces intestinalis]
MPTRTLTVMTAAAGAGAIAVGLSGCFAIGGGGGPVGFDGVQSATIQLESVGTFVSPEEGGYEAAGRGSGFLITPDGLAVTNNHVVTGAGTIKVWRGGDTTKELSAKVLGSSECLDLAVVQLEGSGYPFLDWRKGDIETALDVYAAGFPLGDPTFTETKGIVSKAVTGGETPWASIDSVIEHDARIRGGNSGGPLIDANGALVGVNYAGNDALDYNYAIHRDAVLEVIGDLVDGTDVLSLGINGEALVDEEGTGLGIWVNSVKSGSVADQAGVEPGDLLTTMEGVSLGVNGTLTEYCDVLRTHGQDATLSVELYRPAEEAYYRGQFNGEPITAVPVVGSGSAGEPTGDTVTVADDSGAVTFDAPASWSQIDGAPVTDANGTTWQAASAAPDLAGFEGTWSTPGATVYATPGVVMSPDAAADLVSSGAAEEGCTSTGREPFDDGFHTGVWEIFTGCGGSTTYVVVGATDYDGTYTTIVAAQGISDADLEGIDQVLGTFYASY